MAVTPQEVLVQGVTALDFDIGVEGLFTHLNTQLGIILATAELLEAKSSDPAARERAGHVVASALSAMAITRGLQVHSDDRSF
ncbi:MAG: hypothetical protein U0Q12_09770 [Vicinamibacterales bacterium]